MALDLSNYSSLSSALFVKIETYTTAGVNQTITFSDYHKDITLNTTNYTGLGQLLTITDTQSDLRITPQSISIGISGIPSTNISTVFDTQFKGSKVSVLRGIFDPVTGEIESITGNPAGRFYGVIDNFSISDEMNSETHEATTTLVLVCSSIVGLLNRKTNGRETNPKVQKALYPGDLAMDRVPNLTNANFNFGGTE